MWSSNEQVVPQLPEVVTYWLGVSLRKQCLRKFQRIPLRKVLGCREVIRIRKQFKNTKFFK